MSMSIWKHGLRNINEQAIKVPRGAKILSTGLQDKDWCPCGACRYTGYEHKSVRLVLSCGHEQVRKASAGVPARARCKDCEREKQ